LIELEPLLQIIIGIIIGGFIGSIIGVEYGSWRGMRKLQKTFFTYSGIDEKQWKAAASPETKRALILAKLRELGETIFPMPNIPRPPLKKVKTLKEKEETT